TPDPVRTIDEHLTIEAPGAKQRGIEDFGTIRRGEQDQAMARIEAVHLDQKLVQRLLLFVVSAHWIRAACASERVELIDEDDRRRALARLLEQVTHARRADADEHFDELRAVDREERNASLARNRARQ